MWVVKLGGSLIGSRELKEWLDIIARLGDGKVIIVPGGGVFADAVRTAQKLSGVDDVTAHQMAVMSMDQCGVMMAGLNPSIVTAASELELAERGWQHRGIVWLPSRMVIADETIPANWDMTSDSLAAWLAQKIGATHLLLVKSLRPEAGINLEQLVDQGIVDPCLPEFVRGQGFKTWLVNKADYQHFQQAFSDEVLAEIGYPITQ